MTTFIIGAVIGFIVGGVAGLGLAMLAAMRRGL